jgi:hypothetical protein
MPWLDHQRNVFKSLIEPPPGYALVQTDVVTDSIEGPDDDEILMAEHLDENHGLNGAIIFRAIIDSPYGKLYTAGAIDSKAELCTKGFWEKFWKQATQGGKQ